MTRVVLAAVGMLLLPTAARAQESVFNLPAFAVPEEGWTVRTRAMGGAGDGLSGDVAQLIRILLALAQGLFALPQGHQLHLAAPAAGEGEDAAETFHLGERRRYPLGSDAL